MDPENREEEIVSPQENPNTIQSFFSGNKIIIAAILGFFVILIPLLFLLYAKPKTSIVKNNTDNSDVSFSTPYVPDELVVGLKGEYTSQELEDLKSEFKTLGVIDQQKAYSSDRDYLKNYYVLKFKPGTDLKAAKAVLDKTGEIEASHPNYILKTQDAPVNDPYYTSQWDMDKIDMPDAWKLAKGKNNIIAAVIDTGIDYNHPDFAGRTIIKGPNYIACSKRNSDKSCAIPGNDPLDDHGHGSHVAGVIGAVTNNNIGIAGINWDITLMAVKSQDSSGAGTIIDVVSGILYAIDNKANVINMSLTSGDPLKCSSVPELQDSISEAISKRIVVVIAAGNENQDASVESPPSCNGVIVVGATDQNDQRFTQSNYGPRVDIAAPGVGILSTIVGGYGTKQGTSMAAPHVAGVAALLLSVNPNLTSQQVRDCIVNNADPIQTDQNISGKRLNAYKTLNACSGLAPISVAPTLPPIPTSTPVPQPTTTSQYQISGNVFVDTNGNGQKDAGEPGFPGVVITTGGQDILTTYPDSNGNFVFNNVSQGSYTVSALVNGVKVMTTSPKTLSGQNGAIIVRFAFPPEFLTPTPTGQPATVSPTPIVIEPTLAVAPTGKPKATPTPIKLYTCKQGTSSTAEGTIQFGNLICTPK